MRKLITSLTLGIIMTTSTLVNASTNNLMAILTAPEPQTQLMAMVLSMQSLKQGVNVNILLCGPAADMALKEAPLSATAPQKPMGMSPQGLMQKIMASGGKVEVCAIYLPNKGVSEDSLIDGIKSAKPAAMAKRLLADDTRIMSF
jgi:predicted peroxiredoxin